MTLRVRVPATTANVGSGFDAVGIAFDWYDEVELVTGGSGLSVEVSGEGADSVPRDASHLVVASLLQGLADLGAEAPEGMALRCRNTIPHARGLGSSAAAIVAGLALAHGIARPGAELDRDWLTRRSSLIEGHPDNAGAAVHGGAVLGWIADGEVGLVTLPLAEGLSARVWVPAFEVPTSGARGVLPAQVPHADAVAQAITAALLPLALTGRTDLLLTATADRLHQSYRAPMMEPSFALVGRLREAGVPAAISGAGPTVVALGTDAQLRLADDVEVNGFSEHRLGAGSGVSLVLS